MEKKECPCLLGETRCVACYLAKAEVITILGPNAPTNVHPQGMDKFPELNCQNCKEK